MNHYSSPPQAVKYLKIEYSDLKQVIGRERFEKVCEVIYDHHCQMATKDGMFVVERFFCNDINDDDELELNPVRSAVIDYLNHYGIGVNEGVSEGCDGEIAKGYDGVLLDWSW